MEELKSGDLVFFTAEYEKYIYDKNPKISIPLVNRIGKIEEIIDWDSEKGRIIKEAREKNGKWDSLPIEDCKYVVSVFYPDLVGRKGQKGVVERGMCIFEKSPHNDLPFFKKVPDWFFREIKKKCESFEVEKNVS